MTQAPAVVVALLLSGLLAACASPAPTQNGREGVRERMVSRAAGGVSVSAGVPAREEIEAIFGVPLHEAGIQPVWMRIQNLSAYAYVLFLRSIDPDYFSPYEVARRGALRSEQDIENLYPSIRDLEVERFIAPGAEVEGYVYTHLDEGLKAINVDLVGNRRLQSFNLMAEVPGIRTDYANLQNLVPDGPETPALDERALRAWLEEELPCCTRSADGKSGDPLNLVLVGELDSIQAALIDQHWDVTEEVTRASLWRLVRAFVSGSRYRYAPVSPLYLFDRRQDISFQKARVVIDERNHIRLWRAPVSYGSTPVWVGHISRDAGIKASGRFWPPTTHVIDPAVDEARFYFEQDLLYSQHVERIGLAGGAGASSVDVPRTNAEGDPYFTDGLRAVFFVTNRVVPIDEIEALEWRLPAELEPFRESIFVARDAERGRATAEFGR